MIELQNVSLRYGEREILDNVSLTIEDNKIKAVLGPSGVGKSTILKLILGLIKPNSGSILIDGTDITRLKESQLYPIRRKMGIVFQGNALFDSMTISENLGFFLRENLNLNEEETRRRVREQVEFAGLEGYEDALPENLSGGMKKRVAIGRALIFNPKMILFDEPTAGLDPVSSKKILSLIGELRKKNDLGAVLVTHIIDDVFMVADSVAVLYKGQIIFDDDTHKLHESDHPFIRSILSDKILEQ
ncbi:ATP-binding cassette domain-containing protein [Prosthecochloris sp. N3]|uniref:ATP-binding cassette domain-containing protein n=1 Tax=Prosthecochloris ethylica TaxID=2743976 RepID=A0ABR9XVF4_9CHLB|nr:MULTISPECIES: ATP-binding cassette domain-containing protein [Prosthecochloris]MEC9487120.1 ATP-binding cassette domain-containing protein [Prosthecochloris sp.]MBF0587340.1 ATP-binding cassette domain-containing protein [Prosthecochloris ethylica]MBF0637631.1 ATP-binding cassette domain-containing protein [Prosthecochloris ethylica]NUK48262.1 ATP-binding cassette domain-containing protein [Prosthecochloris ethylica]RNA64522.1 ATP-binding cassette domain-containing protein [Prosthecochloris